jgi:DNA mismatch repair ATPase MutS
MNFFSIVRSIICIYSFVLIAPLHAEIARDLELDAVFRAINHTQSKYGEQVLRSLLLQPLADASILHSRQEIIAHIANHAELHVQLTKLLQTFARQESHFQHALEPAGAIETATLKEFYFSSSYFASWNHSPIGLELGQIAHLGNLCSSMVQHALAFTIFTWGLNEEHVCPSHPAKEHEHSHKKKSHKHKIACNDHHHDHACTHHEHHDHNHGNSAHSTNNIKRFAQSPEFKYAFQLWHGIAQIQELYSIQAIVRNNMKCIKELQTQLMGVSQGIRTINRIHTLLKSQPEITNNLAHYSELEKVCTSHHISEKLTLLLNLLNTNTFKGKPSAFSRIGIILAAYKLLQEVGSELQPALIALGEIDAYVSCAELLNKSTSNGNRYSFADYNTTNATPFLHAQNFWHPLVAGDCIELNSISLGLHNSVRNIILTGPNACGKSTNLKALTLCAYLAQTITLVPAEQYSQTLYKEIYSAIVVSDKIQENKSLFVAELTDAEELLTRAESLGTGEYMIIVLDELFKSTHHEKGQRVAVRLLEHLYALPNVITIVSTHFEKLIELADKNSTVCANYTVDDFKLKPGVGSPDNAFDIVGKKTRSRLLEEKC